MAANPEDPRTPYYLGNLLYDRLRHMDAIILWEKAAKLAPDFSIVRRNLGIGLYNVHREHEKARAAYDKVLCANPDDARVLYERDQLWKRLGVCSKDRLGELEKYSRLVSKRDDLTVELCALYNRTEQPEKALGLLKFNILVSLDTSSMN